MKKNEQSLWDSWSRNKRSSTCKLLSEGKGKYEAEKVLKEIMANNSPNLAKCINLQIQEAEENSNWINPNKSTPKHILNFQKLKT